MVIEQQYGVTVAEDPETNREIFRSVRTLAAFVTENRVE
jgi:hypothetical protein